MYIPPAFAETDRFKLHEFIEQHSFGLLVSELAGVPLASHLPFLLDRNTGQHGTLIGHMARANPQWQNLSEQTVLAVFQGPHTYISPTWYEAENTVPTWNYLAVHVYGRIVLVEDESALLEIVQQTVSRYERHMPRPWTADLSTKFVSGLLAQIVGFRIEIEKIEGKFKLNQNQPRQRQEKVAAALAVQGGENAQAIATLMQMNLRESSA
jgi:transcriptional regulator